MNYKFIIAESEIIQSQEVGKAHFTLRSKMSTMMLLNITYALKCDSNLISLGQLYKSRISYHNHPDFMVFKQEGNTLTVANRHKNFFVLETSLKAIAMLVKRRSRPTYLLSIDLQMKLWYQQPGYASNTRIVKASKPIDRIDITIKKV